MDEIDAAGVNPTCVGMNRRCNAQIRRIISKPHMRGDEPSTSSITSAMDTVNPTCVGMNRKLDYVDAVGMTVNPTCVGMNRLLWLHASSPWSKPHMRGDEPSISSPHLSTYTVNPTCVGMNRCCLPRSRCFRS